MLAELSEPGVPRVRQHRDPFVAEGVSSCAIAGGPDLPGQCHSQGAQRLVDPEVLDVRLLAGHLEHLPLVVHRLPEDDGIRVVEVEAVVDVLPVDARDSDEVGTELGRARLEPGARTARPAELPPPARRLPVLLRDERLDPMGELRLSGVTSPRLRNGSVSELGEHVARADVDEPLAAPFRKDRSPRHRGSVTEPEPLGNGTG